VHADLYRIKKQAELPSTGIFEVFLPSNIVTVEWPELLTKQLKPPYFVIHFLYREKPNDRTITIEKFDNHH
jgi:tRNA A37 threonylcarbamoyladenosine biosynthesis protein TsaE